MLKSALDQALQQPLPRGNTVNDTTIFFLLLVSAVMAIALTPHNIDRWLLKVDRQPLVYVFQAVAVVLFLATLVWLFWLTKYDHESGTFGIQVAVMFFELLLAWNILKTAHWIERSG